MKKILAGILAVASPLFFTACSSDEKLPPDQNYSETVPNDVSNSFAVDIEKLVTNYAGEFKQLEYKDAEKNLAIDYNIFLPKDYSESNSYPLVVFIADASLVGKNPIDSVTQGRGALVWTADEWQSKNPCIVVVPTYNDVVIDDRNGYNESEYVEFTRQFIEDIEKNYAVDSSRVYGTGQSMGCMTTMLLAAKYPDLYSACMLVDGQWDINELKGLESQKFVYFAAEDDDRAFSGLNEVADMFEQDQIEFARAEWNGTWSPDELSNAADKLFAENKTANFITWQTGTIEARGQGRGSYHMGSFDYAYNCVDVMEWLFNQKK